jgi:hypothetical protein
VANLFYTFEDRETGEFRTIAAPNQSAARQKLGGVWAVQPDRTEAWSPCDIEGLRLLLEETQAKEREAHAAVLAANPTGKAAAFPMPEALAAFTAAEEHHRKLLARCADLMRLIMAGLE